MIGESSLVAVFPYHPYSCMVLKNRITPSGCDTKCSIAQSEPYFLYRGLEELARLAHYDPINQ